MARWCRWWGGWREVRTLVIGERATGADGEPTTRALSYFSRMTDATSFTDAALGEVLRRGTDQARTVAAVADGAPWCQAFFAYHVPQAVRMLDFPHAVEHRSAVAQAVFGRGTPATSDWLGQQCHALRAGRGDAVIAAIAALPVAATARPDETIALRDRTVAYFATRRAQIAYADFIAAGLPIGRGAVESATKLVVEARLTGAGMHWQPAHVDALLALRCARCSDRWEPCWRRVTDHRPAPPPPPQRASLPSAIPAPLPPSAAVVPPRTARTPTIVDGKPTIHHPWNQGLAQRTPRPHPDNC